MCIAVYKPMGQTIPSKKTFKNCFDNNSHGAGFMFALDGKVHIEKGFMTFDAFRQGLKKKLKDLHIKDNGKSMPMVFHFRITSQGGVEQALTHPYPLCDNYDQMKQLSVVSDFGVAHNGIIDFASNYGVKDHNDTMEFIKNVLYPMIKGNKNWYQDEDKIDILDYLLDGNRVAVMDGDGHVELFGNWTEDKGIFYSNCSYSYERKTYDYKSLTDNGWYKVGNTWYKNNTTVTPVRKDEDYPFNEDDYDEDDKWYKKASQLYNPLSDKQVSDLYTYGRLQCSKCGEDMILEYDETTDCYIAMCPECGEIYYLDDETASFAISQDIGYDDDQYYENYDYGYSK